MQNYQTYYSEIVRPFFAPPEWLFGLAWGIIYPLIIIAGGYLFLLAWRNRVSWKLFFVYCINLIANIAFTPLLLKSSSMLYATIDIVIVLVTLAYLECAFWKKHKILFWLLLPYLLWGTFATILQVTILFLN